MALSSASSQTTPPRVSPFASSLLPRRAAASGFRRHTRRLSGGATERYKLRFLCLTTTEHATPLRVGARAAFAPPLLLAAQPYRIEYPLRDYGADLHDYAAASLWPALHAPDGSQSHARHYC